MTKKKLEKLFELCEELYAEEQKKSGMVTPIPYAWAKRGGELLVYSSWNISSEKIQKAIKHIQ